MKKLILIFSLLLSSLNVSAELLRDTKIMSNEITYLHWYFSKY